MLGVGGRMTTIGPWYRDLRKPTWNPPNWIFGPAWTAILGLAALRINEGSFGAAPANAEALHILLPCGEIFSCEAEKSRCR